MPVVPPLALGLPSGGAGVPTACSAREDSFTTREDDMLLMFPYGELRNLLQDMFRNQTAQIIEAIQVSKQPMSARYNEPNENTRPASDRDALPRVLTPRANAPLGEIDALQCVPTHPVAVLSTHADSPRGEGGMPPPKSQDACAHVPRNSEPVASLTEQVRHHAASAASLAGNVLGRYGHEEDFLPTHGQSRLEEAYQHVSQRQLSQLPRAIRVLHRCIKWWNRLRAGSVKPKRRWIDRLVRNDFFAAWCGIVIVVHSVFAVVEANYLISNYSSSTTLPTTLPREYLYLEFTFAAWYTLEFALRIASNGSYFFLGPDMVWNIFDVFIVLVSIFVVVGTETPIQRWAFLRTLRIVRVIKIVRLVRILSLFGLRRLQLMINCILGSLTTLFWCIVLLAFTGFIFSVYFVQTLALSLDQQDHANVSSKEMDNLVEFFGSVQRAELSLFMAISGGVDWYEIWKIISIADWGAQWIFLFYVVFCMMALLNIITSIFVEKALALAQPDAHSKMVEQRREQLRKARRFREVFTEMDLDSSNTISLAEFTTFLKKPEFDHFLHEAGIDIKDAHTFFSMLLDHRVSDDEELDISTLISTCMHIQGTASSLDVQVMRYELKELMRGQRKLMKAVTEGSGRVENNGHASASGTLAS